MEWKCNPIFSRTQALEMLGFIPTFLAESDPRPAKEQLNERYAHGGGWRKFEGFTLRTDCVVEEWALEYPGDPDMQLIAYVRLRGELIAVFEHAWVAVVAADGTYEISRMD